MQRSIAPSKPSANIFSVATSTDTMYLDLKLFGAKYFSTCGIYFVVTAGFLKRFARFPARRRALQSAAALQSVSPSGFV